MKAKAIFIVSWTIAAVIVSAVWFPWLVVPILIGVAAGTVWFAILEGLERFLKPNE